MTTTHELVQAHYRADGLVERIDAAVRVMAPNGGPIDPEQLAGLDQFHTRGLAATLEIARDLALAPGQRLLDAGCGLSGPARVFAKRFGAIVEGVDLSESFIAVARHLNAVCGLDGSVNVAHGDATRLPFPDGEFDVVVTQHVAMNIADRTGLYREARRVLRLGGQFATYDIVRVAGEPHYPLPWARESQASTLLSETETRNAVTSAGFEVRVWRDDGAAANAFFADFAARTAVAGPTLGLAMGPDFVNWVGNLARSIREGRL
jgi:sarcosine/dimethylglycine N-methyltransferase